MHVTIGRRTANVVMLIIFSNKLQTKRGFVAMEFNVRLSWKIEAAEI
jgi:hypothetical protein